MGDFNIGNQIAKGNIYNTTGDNSHTQINNFEEDKLNQVESSLLAIKKELTNLELPTGVSRETFVKQVNEKLDYDPENMDPARIKEKLENVNEYLRLVGKTLSGINTIVPHLKTVAKIIGLSNWLGI